MHRQSEYQMSYEMSDLRVQMRGSGGLELTFSPANKSIYGYDNIRTALKSVFPTLVDPTPIKRIPVAQKLKQQFKYPPKYEAKVKPNVTND